jgi:cytochrome c551/c552
MRRRSIVMIAAAVFCSVWPGGASLAAAGTHAAATAAAVVGGVWGSATEVPGTAALNKGGVAAIISVSCATAGNCSAGGSYVDGSGHGQVFVVGEANGVWGTAKEVPGTAALNKGGVTHFASVSCATAGNCSAGGDYVDGSGHGQAFVATEANGAWGTAKEVPGTAALNKGGAVEIDSVSCATAGNCSAGGYYKDGSGHQQAFVVGETNGAWGTAKEVPGTAALNKGGVAEIASVSCATAGNCSAGGLYADGSGHTQVFVVGEANGAWGTAKEVPGTAALNKGGAAATASVSCATAGNCSAGGSYLDGSSHQQVFVVGEVNGVWGTAKEVPGTAVLNTVGFASLHSISCATPGSCSAVGFYNDSAGQQAFVVSKTNGTWGTAEEVPGTAALNKDGRASANSVSCAAAGKCSAGGNYLDGSRHIQAFVVGET